MSSSGLLSLVAYASDAGLALSSSIFPCWDIGMVAIDGLPFDTTVVVPTACSVQPIKPMGQTQREIF